MLQPVDALQSLFLGPADRDQHSSAGRELLRQSDRYFRRCGCHEDSVERGKIGQTYTSVAGVQRDVLDAQGCNLSCSLMPQGVDSLDAGDGAGQSGENRGLIARSRPDLQDSAARRDGEMFGHVGNDKRLADCLTVADGQRAILIRFSLAIRGDEKLAGHAADRVEHIRLAQATSDDLLVDHPPPQDFAFAVGWDRHYAAACRVV